jgi:tetratricopeptide (TPR) repeat protein
MAGCAGHPPVEPPPIGPPAPAPAAAAAPSAALELPENAAFLFLSAQRERRAGRFDQSIMLLRRAIQLDPDSAYLKRELAGVFLQNKEEENALAVVEELLAEHPDDAAGWVLYGSIRQMRRETAKAIQGFERAIRLNPDDEKIYPVLAGLYLDAKDPQSAERVLKGMIERFPGAYEAHFMLGRVHLARGRTEAAVQALRRAAELDPEGVDPLFELLRIAQSQGRRKSLEVQRLCQEILARDPDNSRALLALALYHRQDGGRAEAEAILRRLGGRSLTEFEVILQLVQGYVDPKRFDEALFLIQGLLLGAPESPDLHHLKGFSLFGLKKYGEALPEFRRVTPESRFHQDALVHTAIILQEQGQTDAAVATLADALRRNPENLDLKFYTATIYEEAGRLEEAEGALRQALEKDPRNSRFLFRLGVILDKRGDKAASIEAMRRVLEVDPQNASALNYIGYTYAELGENLDEAEQLIRKALELKPDDGYITDSLGWVYHQKGDFRRALHFLKKAAALVPDDPTILEHIGDTYLRLHDKAKAMTYYQRALSKKAKDPAKAKEAAALREKIRGLSGRR